MATTTQMCLYEGMYLLSANVSDEQRVQSLDTIQKEIESFGGGIKKKHNLGVRKLAYELDGHKEGQYHVWYFEAPPGSMETLWKDHRINRERLHLLRFMTLRVEPEQVLEEIKYKSVGER